MPSNCLKTLNLPETDINLDTPNRKEILKNGVRRGSNESLLGRGTFGTVYKGTYKGKQVAAKIINNKNSNKLSVIENEFNILGWKHKNIIGILHIEIAETYSVIIMERFPGRCLQSVLEQVQISLKHRLRIAKDIVSGIQFCHQNGILHLDIKPQNVLVTFSTRIITNKFENYLCKLCDFGSSAKIVKYDSIPNKTIYHRGTIRYMAPEALKNENLTEASDIYSFGVTIWQLKSRLIPYCDIDSNEVVIYKVVHDNLRPSDYQHSESINTSKYKDLRQPCSCHNFSTAFENEDNKILRTLIDLPICRDKERDLMIFRSFCDNLSEPKTKTNIDQYEETAYKKLYSRCWNLEPLKRPSVNEILQKLGSLLILISYKENTFPHYNADGNQRLIRRL